MDLPEMKQDLTRLEIMQSRLGEASHHGKQLYDRDTWRELKEIMAELQDLLETCAGDLGLKIKETEEA